MQTPLLKAIAKSVITDKGYRPWNNLTDQIAYYIRQVRKLAQPPRDIEHSQSPTDADCEQAVKEALAEQITDEIIDQ